MSFINSREQIKVAQLPPHQMVVARSKSNPFELIGKAFFINRSAVKLANLDSSCNLLGSTESAFHFADLCSGPGGFSDYITWKRGSNGRVYGYGITLRGPLDFDPSLAIRRSFHVVYGPSGTGDICNPENMDAFVSKVVSGTGSQGVHLVTADGVGLFVTYKRVRHSRSRATNYIKSSTQNKSCSAKL